METVKRGIITYFIKKEAVIVGISDFQYSAYTVYSLQNRKPFYDFRNRILESKENELGDVISLIRLANEHGLIGVASHKPNGVKEK